ncbi:Nucleotidylyl transferase [Clathrospora elynae]|uniref:tyrosine--tRNA ligase n=1 Tax=Clathrospora elynae TaxID=706981 RepID=A0A6A5SCS4_9PLEO|nr:Nucleotidylyl transferase [Clathrospora elynae]
MLSPEQKYDLVARRQSFLTPEDAESLKKLLSEKEQPKIAWETAPTGKPHVGYFVPLTKLVDFLRAGLHVTVYYMDVYGFIVNYIHSMETVEYRRQYYHHLVSAILTSLGVPLENMHFVNESSLSYDPAFVKDSHKLCAIMTQQDAKDITDEVGQTKMLSPMLCAVQQSLSEPYLDLDIQFGGEDQVGLFNHAKRFIPLLGYRQREHVMNVIVAGLDGLKMSSSKPAETKIEFLDPPSVVAAKISAASCPAGEVAQNGVLGMLRDVLVPISEQRLERLRGQTGAHVTEGKDLHAVQRPFATVDAPEGSIFSIGGRHFPSYEALEKGFVSGVIGPEDLKAAVVAAFNEVLAPIQDIYTKSRAWQEVEELAYPGGCNGH